MGCLTSRPDDSCSMQALASVGASRYGPGLTIPRHGASRPPAQSRINSLRAAGPQSLESAKRERATDVQGGEVVGFHHVLHHGCHRLNFVHSNTISMGEAATKASIWGRCREQSQLFGRSCVSLSTLTVDGG